MEARHLLKQLKDDGWYLGDTDGSSRQYVHPKLDGVITVCVRFTDELGPQTQQSVAVPAEALAEDGEVRIETTATGASAYLTGLTGCIATGASEEETRVRMEEAVALHRKALGRLEPAE